MSNTLYNIKFTDNSVCECEEMTKLLEKATQETYYVISKEDLENSELDKDTKKELLDLMEANGDDYLEIA